MYDADRSTTQLRRGVLEFCALAMVETEHLYGVELARRLHDTDLLESEGTLYPLLSRLRKQELVTTSWAESPSGPPRRYYAITARGREALDGFRVEWTSFAASVNHVMGVTHER